MMMGVRAILPLHFFIILPKLHTQSRPTRYIFTWASTIDPARRCDHVCVYNPVTATHQGSRAKINHTDPQTTAIKRWSEGNGDTRLHSHALCWIKMSAGRACVCFYELDESAGQRRPLLDVFIILYYIICTMLIVYECYFLVHAVV